MPGLNPKQEDIDQFVAITQASPAHATRFLADGVTLEGAIEDYFAAQTAGGPPVSSAHDDADEDMLDAALAASSEPTGGARTLSGAPAEELPESWRRRGAANITSVHDEEDEEERRRGNELYTGGERSGLAVQNPDNRNREGGGPGIVNDILQQARDGGREEDEAPSAANPWARVGAGNTLGSEDTPSIRVGGSGSGSRMPGSFGGGEDDDEEEDDEVGGEAVERRLTFWRDGFSIEDGPLFRYDEPRNQQLLSLIRAGRAPLELFDVRFDQPLKISVDQRTGEDYKEAPKKPAKPFSGGGNRLGSATPDIAGASSSTTAASQPPPPKAAEPDIAGASSSTTAASQPPPPKAAEPEIKVDESKPSTTIQLRLGDGTRLVVKVNLDNTVRDLRGIVAARRPDPRSFVLQTTFPSRELPESETVEQAGLKNAVVVQRYV